MESAGITGLLLRNVGQATMKRKPKNYYIQTPEYGSLPQLSSIRATQILYLA